MTEPNDLHDFDAHEQCPCQPTLIYVTEDGRPIWWHINSEFAVPPVEYVAELIAMARWMDLADVLEEA